MKFLAVLTPPPSIYCGCSTKKTFWEDNFTPMNMISCGRINVRKHRDIKDGEKYMILDIYSKIDCMNKREVTSSESKDSIGIPGKGLNRSLDLTTKSPNNK